MRKTIAENPIEAAMAALTVVIGVWAVWAFHGLLYATLISLENAPARVTAILVLLACLHLLYSLLNRSLGAMLFLTVWFFSDVENR